MRRLWGLVNQPRRKCRRPLGDDFASEVLVVIFEVEGDLLARVFAVFERSEVLLVNVSAICFHFSVDVPLGCNLPLSPGWLLESLRLLFGYHSTWLFDNDHVRVDSFPAFKRLVRILHHRISFLALSCFTSS